MTDLFLTRRHILNGGFMLGAAALAGCSTSRGKPRVGGGNLPPKPAEPFTADYASMYAAKSDGGFKIPAVPWQKIPKWHLRQEVPNTTGEPAGHIVVSTSEHSVYYTMSFGRAMRYGCGLGRQGFEWSGRAEVKRKSQWPKWHPPDEMIDRQPELEKYRTTYDKKNDEWLGGMDGGPNNPLGARALYLYQGEVDTLYRLHGSPEWWSIGKSVSSGCVRLINQDIIDLYSRAGEGTPVLVR